MPWVNNPANATACLNSGPAPRLRIVDEPPGVALEAIPRSISASSISYLPFMVLPIYATLEKMDETLIEGRRRILGCPLVEGRSGWVTLPLGAGPGVDRRRLCSGLHPRSSASSSFPICSGARRP